jgi:hypothetical protein
VTPCGSCKNRRLGGNYRIDHLGDKNRQAITANVVSSSAILVSLMMKKKRCSETSVVTRATRRHIPEDGILHSHRSENLKSYIIFRYVKPNVKSNVTRRYYLYIS